MDPSEGTTTRVLVVYEDNYRSYGETMAGTVRGLKPGAEVSLVQARELASEVVRFDQHLVVCNRPNAVDPGGRAAWVQLSDDPDEPSEFCLAGRRWGARNPGLGEVLALLDRTGGLLREGTPGVASPRTLYTLNLVEGLYSELRTEGVLPSSPCTGPGRRKKWPEGCNGERCRGGTNGYEGNTA